jgi:hypothetical protein
MESLDRRSFLKHAGALGLGAVAWACAKKTKQPTASASGSKALSVVATAEILAKGDSRNAFALFRGERPIAPLNVKARLSKSDGQPFDVPVLRENVRRGVGGSQSVGTETYEIYVVHHAFDDGIWLMDVTVDGAHPQPAAFQVAADSPEPLVGAQAIVSQSPTVADHHGVDPICTRTPPCSMHEISIADAIAAGKPTIISFATPKFCQSRTCGPVVDVIEDVSKGFKDQASFIHVEVFKNEKVASTETGDSPTFHEWHLSTEPWTYFVGADGVIKDRWLGPLGTGELRSAVTALVKG